MPHDKCMVSRSELHDLIVRYEHVSQALRAHHAREQAARQAESQFDANGAVKKAKT